MDVKRDNIWVAQNRLFEVIDRISVIILNLNLFAELLTKSRKENIEAELSMLHWEEQVLKDYLDLCKELKRNSTDKKWTQ